MTTATGFMEVFQAYEPTKAMADAKALAVKTPADRQMATDLWDSLRAFRKKAEAQKEEVCRPLKTAWDSAKVPFDTFVKECQGYETRLAGLMSTWDKEQKRIADAEQARLQAIVDKANAKRSDKAQAKGEEAVLRCAPVVQAPERNIVTQAGSTQGRSLKKVYHVKGEKDGETLAWDASNGHVSELLKGYPSLFVLDRVRFNALAKTGMLDNNANVSIEETFVYTQRG